MSDIRYLCLFAHSGVRHVLCCVFGFLRLVCPMLPFSLDYPFLTSPSVFSRVYLQNILLFYGKVYIYFPQNNFWTGLHFFFNSLRNFIVYIFKRIMFKMNNVVRVGIFTHLHDCITSLRGQAWAHKTSLLATFNWSQESERCGIDFCPFSEFDLWFWNCSNSVVLFVFHFISAIRRLYRSCETYWERKDRWVIITWSMKPLVLYCIWKY